MKRFVNPDHPVCAALVASHLLLMAQPPLLCQEGLPAEREKTMKELGAKFKVAASWRRQKK